MRIRRLNGMFAIANQVELNTVKDLAQAGYKTVICNRPDGESADQVGFADIAREAQKFGLKAIYLPITENGATAQDQAAFHDYILDCPKPIVAYCRSGTRPATLWTKFDVAQNGGQADGPERRVDAMRAGAMSVQHAASMAFASSFNTPRTSTVASISKTGMGRRSA